MGLVRMPKLPEHAPPILSDAELAAICAPARGRRSTIGATPHRL